MIKKSFFKKPQNDLEVYKDFEREGVPNVPDEMVVQCPQCKSTIFLDDLEKGLQVCDNCNFHFRMDVRSRIEMIADEGSFVEMFGKICSVNPLDFPGYDGKLEKAKNASGEIEAVACGTCKINGIDCALFVMDPNFMMGSMGSVVGEKITLLFEHATKSSLPVVGYTVSGGARMQEGILSLMQMAKTSGAVKYHSDAGNLYITVLTDPTTGGVTASFAMEGDIILSEPRALIGFAGPRVIEQTIRQRLPIDFQRAEFLLDKGFVDAIVDRRKQKETISKLLFMHVTNNRKTFSPTTKSKFSQKSKNQVPKSSGTAYENVVAARKISRPTGSDYIDNIFTDFIEMHGDRRYADDNAVVAGLALFNDVSVTVIALEKGHTTEERIIRNFGAANPEGYRKALRQMKLAEKFGRPVVCFVDTSGAFCGIGAEERGQGQAIAENLMEMMTLKTPIVSILIGEGGSGGALALSVADQVWMLENAIYSVITPEGCASILWKDSSKVAEAAGSLKLTATDLYSMGVIEKIITEPENFSEIYGGLSNDILDCLANLQTLDIDTLLANRYQRFRKIGVCG